MGNNDDCGGDLSGYGGESEQRIPPPDGVRKLDLRQKETNPQEKEFLAEHGFEYQLLAPPSDQYICNIVPEESGDIQLAPPETGTGFIRHSHWNAKDGFLCIKHPDSMRAKSIPFTKNDEDYKKFEAEVERFENIVIFF